MYKSILRTAKVAVEKVTSLGLIALMAMLSFMVVPQSASAADLNTESLAQSNPTVSFVGNAMTFDVSNVTLSSIMCIRIELDTAADGSGSLPGGMSITGATYDAAGSDYIPDAQTWTAAGVDGTGVISITNATGEVPASASGATVRVTGITNGTTPDTTYFAIVSTYNNINCSSSPVDSSGISTLVFTEGVVVSATVNPSLTFTVGSTTCSLGVLTASTTGSCSHTMTAASNATSGYAISYIASGLLTSPGSDDITAMSGAASIIGTEQFGLNLVNNATPSVGADPSLGSGAAVAPYAIADNFTFTTAGASVANTTGPSATTTFTVSYIANISSATEAGLYSKVQTYNVTATY